MIDFFKVNKILMMGDYESGEKNPSQSNKVNLEVDSNDFSSSYARTFREVNIPQSPPIREFTETKKLIQDIQSQRGSLKHTKTKAALIGALATSGAVIGGAGAAYYFSDDIIKYFNQYGKQIIKEVPIPEELLPGNNNKLPNELLPSWNNKLPIDDLTPDTILPDGTRLGNYVAPEMTDIMMSDPALREFVVTGRLPATDISDLVIDPEIINPEIIDPEILMKTEEFKGMNLEFLKDPAIIGGIAASAASAGILAVILLALIKVREIKAGEKLVDDAKKLNELVNDSTDQRLDADSEKLSSERSGGMSEDLKGALNNAIGWLPQNKKLNVEITKLNVSAAKTSGATATEFALSGNASERLQQLIELRDEHFGKIGEKGMTTKTVARRAFDSVLTMIDEEIEKTAGIIADTLSPEFKGSKIDKKTGQAKEGNVVKVDELAMQRHNKFMEFVNQDQALRREYDDLFPPSRSVQQTNNPSQMSYQNPNFDGSEF